MPVPKVTKHVIMCVLVFIYIHTGLNFFTAAGLSPVNMIHGRPVLLLLEGIFVLLCLILFALL